MPGARNVSLDVDVTIQVHSVIERNNFALSKCTAIVLTDSVVDDSAHDM